MIIQFFKKLVTLTLVSSLLINSSLLAQTQKNKNPLLNLESNDIRIERGFEFIAGEYPNAVLMPVKIFGSIQRAGVYHVPLETDIISLITYAGGTTEKANLSNVSLNRKKGSKKEGITLDLKEIIEKPVKENIFLSAEDEIYIPTNEPIISQNSQILITMTATILGIALTTFILSDQLSR